MKWKSQILAHNREEERKEHERETCFHTGRFHTQAQRTDKVGKKAKGGWDRIYVQLATPFFITKPIVGNDAGFFAFSVLAQCQRFQQRLNPVSPTTTTPPTVVGFFGR